MHRIDTQNAVETLPAPKPVGTPGYFQQHDFAQSGTILDSDLLNSIQEEIANVIISSGASLDKSDNTQLYTAIQSIITSGPTAGLYLNSDLDVLTYALTNVTGSNFAINLSGDINVNAAKINISNNLVVGNGAPINRFINEENMASNSASAITDMYSVMMYVNRHVGAAKYYALIRGYTLDTLAAGTTSYMSIGAAQSTNTNPCYTFVMPYDGSINNLNVLFIVGSSGSTPGTVTFTLQKNGVDTAITGTVAGSSGSYTDTTSNYATVASGDTIQLKVVVSGDAQKYPAGLSFWFRLYPLSTPP